MTRRTRQVYDLANAGYSNREIADMLFIEVQTVKTYYWAACRELGVEPVRSQGRRRWGTPVDSRHAGLTRRQREVAWYVERGYTDREIAERLGISDQTVKNHLTGAREKMREAESLRAVRDVA